MRAAHNPATEKTETPAMFSAIARRYDLLNHVLSMNIDRRWRRTLVEMSGADENSAVLDAATGTADVALAFASGSRASAIVGLDRSAGMLEVGRAKIDRGQAGERIRLLEGDVLALPFADDSFDVVTIAFGLRNLPDYAKGVREMTRVLKPGGRLLVLEFFPPSGGLFLKGYRFYLGRVVPIAGRVISGSAEAYRYLASSIENFITHAEIIEMFSSAGLTQVAGRKLTGGIAYVYHGVKTHA